MKEHEKGASAPRKQTFFAEWERFIAQLPTTSLKWRLISQLYDGNLAERRPPETGR